MVAVKATATATKTASKLAWEQQRGCLPATQRLGQVPWTPVSPPGGSHLQPWPIEITSRAEQIYSDATANESSHKSGRLIVAERQPSSNPDTSPRGSNCNRNRIHNKKQKHHGSESLGIKWSNAAVAVFPIQDTLLSDAAVIVSHIILHFQLL